MLATWKSLSSSKVIDLARCCRADGPVPFAIEVGSKYEKMVVELLENGNSQRITQCKVKSNEQ